MSVSVVVVGFGPSPGLSECLEALVADVGPEDEVVLVDNGLHEVPGVAGVRVVRSPSNVGFAGGCHVGADASRGDVLAFVNSDAVVRPGAIAALADELEDGGVGLVSGCVVLRDDPRSVNSVGNPVHVTGLCWAGGLGEPAARHQHPVDIASVSGALFAVRRTVWESLGGLRRDFFLYYEDTDLSLRCWLAGLRVRYRPDAVATHAYEFGRNPEKLHLVDRNRLASVLTVYPAHLLKRAAPVIVLCELLLLIVAARDGWFREKLRAWGWVLRNASVLRRERRRLAADVTDPHALDGRLTTTLGATQVRRPPGLSLLDRLVGTYWRRTDPARVPRTAGSRRPDVVVLRSNPRDSSLPRLLTVLGRAHRTLALVWDRTGDYECPVRLDTVEVRRNTTPGRYHHASTLVGIARLQPWLLWRTLRARPRAVHAMDLDTGVVSLVAARILRVPFVYQCLDPYAGALPSGWPPVVGRVVGRVENAVITRSDLFVITDLLRLPQHEGARPRRVVELPNIPMTPVEPQPFSRGGLVVGYVGSLVLHRNLELLVDTVAGLEDEDVSLVLGGFGPLDEALRGRAAAHPNVRFLGWVDDDDLMATLAGFDVFVQVEDPDHGEYRWVSPNKLFESMALGRPIVVAAETLAARRVAETGHGVTVPFGDGDALRTALLGFLRDPELRSSMGDAGRRTFVERWSPDAVTSRVLDAYADVVDEDSSTAVGPVRP